MLGDPDLSRNVSHNWRAGVLLNEANAWSSGVYRDVANAEISSALRNVFFLLNTFIVFLV